MSDIITTFISIVKNHIPELNNQTAKVIEAKIRLQYGGDQTYIAKRAEVVEHKRYLINNELKSGHSIAQIEQLHGIPRSTIYRLINQKIRKEQTWQD